MASSATTGNVYESADAVYESVKSYYGKVLSSSSDLKTSACCTAGRPPQIILDALKKVPQEITDKYYGCGTPLPFGIENLNVLDLGSGSGRDCYIAAALVGPAGTVTGVDMTLEQLEVARRHAAGYTDLLGYPAPNLAFLQGYMESLEEAGVRPGSMDLVISNCVLNLSPDKERVLAEVHRALRPGGEFYFSDMYASRRIPESVRTHPVLWGECLGGALYVEDFKRMCARAGFPDPRELARKPVAVRDPELAALVGGAEFYSITYRCFKLPEIEPPPGEDYGHVAVYDGGIPGCANAYRLDIGHVFETGLPVRVCGNTAAMLGPRSWLGRYFTVTGTRDRHYGQFNADRSHGVAAATASSGCC